MKSAQQKLKMIVTNYKRRFPDEYKLVVKGVEMKRKLASDEYSSIEGSPDMRPLFEISEKLHEMIIMGLAMEELNWWKLGVAGAPNAGGRWFAKQFPEFRLPAVI